MEYIQIDNQEHLDYLAMKCMVFADREGRVLDKTTTGVSNTLRMRLENDSWDIEFRVYQHAYGNGSSSVIVKYRGELVFNAAGRFTSSAYGMQAKTYVPGAWEQEIPAL